MTDIEIARSVKLKNIDSVAYELGLGKTEILKLGEYRAKIVGEFEPRQSAKLILVTSINPTKAGEGKTTVSIGLADALRLLKKRACLALREPSMGPVFGIKGGATGGGYSQIAPMDEINLHFNGDFHAITAANNLLCALIDNHIYQGNSLGIEKATFPRCLDVNDRALRRVTLSSREEGFVITAASEIMAIMCMAENLHDLKNRLGNILIGVAKNSKPVFVKDLGAQDAMAILLKDALNPNLVQTLEGTPAIVHCGPFANIAHGCNSVRATKTALALSEYVVTEAGFGADLGAEKFLDFKCRVANLQPNCVVIVATVRALKLHGGQKFEELSTENLDALKKGFANFKKHIDTVKNVFHLPYVVAINHFASDSESEIKLLQKLLKGQAVLCDEWARGGIGAVDLARAVIEKCEEKSTLKFAYNLGDSIEKKIESVVKKVYGGKGVTFSEQAKQDIAYAKKCGFENFPVIIAKTQYSLSADEKLLGAPKNFVVDVQQVQIRSGAGFLVAVCGKILLMPALPAIPNALKMRIDDDGTISGLS